MPSSISSSPASPSRDLRTFVENALRSLEQPEAARGTSKRVRILKKILRIFPREASVVIWAHFQNELGLALTRISTDSSAAEKLEQAIAAYHRALEVRTREGDEEGWAITSFNLAGTLQKLETPECLLRAAEIYGQVLEVFTVARFPDEWAKVRINQGYLLASLGNEPQSKEFEEALLALEEGLQVLPPERFPNDWGNAAMDLATLLAKRLQGSRADNLERSIGLYRGAAEAFDHAGLPIEKARTQAYLAADLIQRQQGSRAVNLEEAIHLCDEALAVLAETEDPGRVAAWLHLGHALRHYGIGDRRKNQEDAIQAYQFALQAAALESPQLISGIWLGLAYVYQERWNGDPRENIERAFACCEEARTHLNSHSDPSSWAGMFICSANTHLEAFFDSRQEHLECAVQLARKAFEILKGSENPHDWAPAAITLANALRQQQRHPPKALGLQEAKNLYEKVLAALGPVEAPFLWARTATSLGIAYRDSDVGDRSANLERARELFEKALEIQERELTALDWAVAEMHLGSVYSERLLGAREENYERAKDCIEAAIQVQELLGDTINLALARMYLGSVLLNRRRGDHQENIDSAIDNLEQAREVFSAYGRRVDLGNTLLNLASAYQQRESADEQEDIRLGLAACDEGMAIFPREESAYHWAIGTQLRAQLWSRSEGSKERAVAEFHEALEVFRPEALPSLCRMTAHNLGDHHFATGEWAEAVTAYELGAVAEEHLVRAARELAAREAELAESIDLHHKLAFALARCGRHLDAVLALETARARIVLETVGSLDEVRARLAVRADLADIARAAGGDGPLVYLAATPAGALMLTVFAGRPPASEIAIAVEPLWSPALTADFLDALLMEWEESELVGGFLNAVVVGPDELDALLPPILEELGEKLGKPLAEMLLARLESAAVLIPTGRMALLPLHAMSWTGPNGPTTLCEVLDLTYSPSAKLRAFARQQLERVSPKLHLLGIVDPSPEERPLELARFELTAVAKHFPPQASRIFEGAAATSENILPLLADATYLHFSCHGLLETRNPRQSYLELAAGERLSLGEVLTGESMLAARLVVLSACQTGVIESQSAPDAALGFPAGFLAAGAAGVLASLWKVEEVSTALLIRAFYHFHLAEGSLGRDSLSPPAALRRSQLWLREVQAGDLAAFFDGEGELLGGRLRVDQNPAIAEVAARVSTRFWLLDPAAKPFAAPRYWAGFVFSGA